MNTKSFHNLKYSNPVIYKVLRKLGDPFLQYSKKKSNKKKNLQFVNNGVAVFADFCQAFYDSNTLFWLNGGTLLGAIREKGFIKHDMDIDVGVFDDIDFECLNKELLKQGFKLQRRIEIYSNCKADEGQELTYSKLGVSIDIFVFTRIDENFAYTHDFLDFIRSNEFDVFEKVRKITLPFKQLKEFRFLNMNVHIPENYTEHLAAHYGEDFMIPNPNWSTLTSKAASVVKGSIGLIRHSK